ncbi:MAG: hypothetical protein KDC98_12735, partial [Planctomycetes bacterium]|nr:hypothetical protein [Planctomycetota bacterium]
MLSSLAAASLFAAASAGQCTLHGVPGFAAPGGIASYGIVLVAAPAGGFVVTGDPGVGGTSFTGNIGKWDGTGWRSLGGGSNGRIYALAWLPNGDLVAGGDFTSIGGVPASHVARWDGQNWYALGGGLSGLAATVRALVVLSDGSLVAGGNFLSPGGPGNSLARWDGSSWRAFAGGSDWFVTALATTPNGELIAAGTFTQIGGVVVNGIASWDGTSWQPLGSGHAGQYPHDLAVMPNGDIVLAAWFAGSFTTSSYQLGRWDGVSWTPLGGWGGYIVNALAVLPNGDLLIGGRLPWPGHNLGRWDGTTWSAVGSGADDSIWKFAVDAQGNVGATGLFTTLGGTPSSHFGILATPCPATAVANAVGCSSSGGANTFATTELPWIGTTFTATGSGLPRSAIVGAVTGFGTNVVALSGLAPQGQPGCDLVATPDAVQLLFTTTGTAVASLPLPQSLALVGTTLHQQLIPIELDAAGNIVAITASGT